MYCMNCGRKLEDDEIFCQQCGTRRAEDPPKENSAKKEKRIVPYVLAACLILTAGILAGIWIFRTASGKDVSQEANPKTASEVTEPKGEQNYTMQISQYDISDYPTVKIYLEVAGEDGEFIENLNADNFCIREKRSANGEATEQRIQNVAKLDENEGLSIGLIADVSGSMVEDIDQVKTSMCNFLNTVQFENGDEVELVKFSDSAYICASFTNELTDVTRAVNEMTVDGNTRLYDTLMSELERIQSQKNAKCIIAFTDGLDNESIYTADEVAEYAADCQIPVFLIGIGSECDEDALRDLAEWTGGTYQNIEDISLLEENYRSIYQEEKDVYLLEYEIANADHFDETVYVDVSIRLPEQTESEAVQFSFAQEEFFETMYNRFLIAGIDCQTKGERNLLDSGLVVTSEEAYANPDCVAHQSQEAINSGGIGANVSNVYEVLMNHQVLNVYQNEDGSYTIYGMSNYDISKIRTYDELKNDMEKAAITEVTYRFNPSGTEFRMEENRSNYEKLTLVKDSDGKWKFYTRVYEREDGGDPYPVNEIYRVDMY